MSPWHVTHPVEPNLSVVDGCASGDGVGFVLGSQRQVNSGQYQSIMLDKPSGPRSQIKFVKAVVWYAARLVGSGSPMMFYAHDRQSDGLLHEGLATYAPGSENVIAEYQLSPATTAVALGLFCVAPPGAPTAEPCAAQHAVPLLVRGIEVTLSEDVPPGVLQPKGALLGSGPQSGVRALTYAATDPQSGLSNVDVLLDDTVVANRDLTPECFYADFTVCPDAKSESLQVDTRAVPNGPHRLTLRVRDAAGNERVVDGGRTVEVANEPSPESTEVSAYTLSARFKGASRSTLTVPYGRRVSVHGRLTGRPQAPAAGTRIEVLERRDQRGAREISRSPVKTKADGSFSVVLNTTRPSRTVRLAYRPTADSQVDSPALKLRVRAASTVRASLRGPIVRFSGRVLSRPVPRAGKRVLMEGRSPGSAWTAFKRLRTDRNGRFSGTYRLRVRRPGVLLKVRAIVPRENGYGYLGSRSRAVSLRVR